MQTVHNQIKESMVTFLRAIADEVRDDMVKDGIDILSIELAHQYINKRANDIEKGGDA